MSDRESPGGYPTSAHETRPRLPARVLLLVWGTVTLAAAVTLTSWSGLASHDLLFWFAACVVGELLWVRLPLGQATASMAACFHFAALLLLPRGQAMAVAALGSALGESLFMRKPPLRVVFNAGQAALAVGAASACFGLLRAEGVKLPEQVYGLQLLPLLASAAVYFLVNKGAVSVVVSLAEGMPLARVWSANFGGRYELVANGALFSLGALLASHYATNGAGGTLLVVLPLLVAHEGYRHYNKRRERGGQPAATGRHAA